MSPTSDAAALEELAASLGPLARRNVPVGPLTTYRVGGAAAVAVKIENDDDLATLAGAVGSTGVDVLVVGNGSNLLVADDGFPGVAVQLGATFATIELDGTRVRAGGAASLPVLARRTAAAGLTGFEWAVGVPGSVGGAVRMNAGGHGSDMAATVTRVRVVDLAEGEDGVMSAEALAFGYRRSTIRSHQLVRWAELELTTGEPGVAEAEISEIVRWRRAHQPGGQNAGSVFTNPPADSAGRLIEAAGAKGLRLGTAEVSPKHANFIQADDGGAADDVHALMVEVRRRVAEATGVELAVETCLVGFPRHEADTP